MKMIATTGVWRRDRVANGPGSARSRPMANRTRIAALDPAMTKPRPVSTTTRSMTHSADRAAGVAGLLAQRGGCFEPGERGDAVDHRVSDVGPLAVRRRRRREDGRR